MSKRWGAKSRRQICSTNSTHLMEPSPCQEDYITLQKLERGSDCWKHCPQSLTKSKRSPVWRRRRNCSAYEYQSGVLLHPYHTCIAVLQCDTHQEPSLEKKKKLLCIWVPVWSIAPPISHLHCSIAVWHTSGVQSRRKTFITPPTKRSPVWRRSNCFTYEYQSGVFAPPIPYFVKQERNQSGKLPLLSPENIYREATGWH